MELVERPNALRVPELDSAFAYWRQQPLPGTMPPLPLAPQEDGDVMWSEFRKQERRGGSSLSYTTEESIATYVRMVLEDMPLDALLGQEYWLTVDPQLQTGKSKPRLWVVQRRGRPVGAVKVKQPGVNAMTHTNILGELYDHMMTLRSFEGLDHVYGILSSYKQWRFCWLEDTDADAVATPLPRPPSPDSSSTLGTVDGLVLNDKLVLGDIPPWPTVQADNADDDFADDQAADAGKFAVVVEGELPGPRQTRRLYVSRIFEHDDEQLLPTIAAVLLKMAFSPHNRLSSILEPRPVVTSSGWLLQRLSSTFALNFGSMPSRRCTKFILLLRLGQGEFGRAYLAASTTGVACVLKFALAGSDCDLEEEAKQWRTIWGLVGVRHLYMGPENNRDHVLMLPYLRMCRGGAKDQSNEVRLAARRAVDHMVEQGYQHLECYWRHVGLCRRHGELQAVLIDLGNIKRLGSGVSAGDIATARREMLAQLEFEEDKVAVV